MGDFQPSPEALALIIDTHYCNEVHHYPQPAAEFLLKVAVDIELLSPDPLVESANIPVNNGTISVTFSNSPFAIPIRPGIEVAHEVSYESQERPIPEQPGFTEYDTVAAYLGSQGSMLPEADLHLMFHQVDKNTRIKHAGEVIFPAEIEAAMEAFDDPELTSDDRVDIIMRTIIDNRKKRTLSYEMSCFRGLIIPLLELSAI